VTSVDKALDVLMLLSREHTLGVREISRRLGLSVPTVYRLLTNLAAHELAQQVSETHEYKLGWACLDLARNTLADVGVVQQGPAVAKTLRDQTRETVTVQIPAGRDHICVLEVEGLDEIRRRVGIGRRMALHAGASGRAILAFMPPAQIDEYLRGPLEKVSPSTVTDPAELRKKFEEIRAQGYAMSAGESVIGAMAISAPVFGRSGSIEASISISGPQTRLSPEVAKEFTPMVVTAGLLLSRQLGYNPMERQQNAEMAFATTR
jgi:IclR family transcriptional regulator, acetate operon repressor